MNKVANDISSFRTEIMGVATLMILLGHSVFYGQGFVDYGFLQNLFTLGYSGVDIFLFLSGFGLVFSMKKNDKITFYKHRIARIVPSVLAIMFLNVLVNIRHLGGFIFNPLYWFGLYWYIGFILLAYLCFPYLYRSIKRHGYFVFVVSLLFSVLLFLPFLITGHGESSSMTCLITRIPIFVLGACFVMGGQVYLYSKKIIFPSTIIGFLALWLFYYYDNLGGNRTINTYYVFTLLTPSIVWLISCCQKITFKLKLLMEFWRFLGKYSLEIYLVQVTIMYPFMCFLEKHGCLMLVNVFLSFLIVFLMSVSLKFVTDKVKKML